MRRDGLVDESDSVRTFLACVAIETPVKAEASSHQFLSGQSSPEEECEHEDELARTSLIAGIRRPVLQLYEPVRRLWKDRELRQSATHHGHFVATMKSGASMAIFVNLV